MKKLLIGILTLSPIFCFAQSGNDSLKFRPHEINVGFFNIFHLFGNNYSDAYHYDDDFLYLNIYDELRSNPYYTGVINFAEHNTPSLGVGYKYHFKTMKGSITKLHALRFFSDFSVSNYGLNGKSSVIADSIVSDVNKYQKLIFRIGYQSENNYKKIVFYKGFDLLFQGAWVDYDLKGINNGCYDETGKLNVVGFGGSPFVGVRFKINEFFSISTETRLKAAWYTVTRSYSGFNFPLNSNYEGNYTSDHFDLRFTPIGLISLNIHLLPKDQMR